MPLDTKDCPKFGLARQMGYFFWLVTCHLINSMQVIDANFPKNTQKFKIDGITIN